MDPIGLDVYAILYDKHKIVMSVLRGARSRVRNMLKNRRHTHARVGEISQGEI